MLYVPYLFTRSKTVKASVVTGSTLGTSRLGLCSLNEFLLVLFFFLFIEKCPLYLFINSIFCKQPKNINQFIKI